MKIAQIAPLYESVPPKMYGGTERIVSYLTEELVNQGHEVTLFASGDSTTKAKLISHVNHSLRLSDTIDPLAHHIVQLQEVMEKANEFDLLHFHTDYLHFTTTHFLNKPLLTTLHGRLDLPELQHIYKKFPNQPVASISNSQREPIPYANWMGTIYHGLPIHLYQKGKGEGDYVVFMGRISREKRPDHAIEIAKRAGVKIKIAAKIDKVDKIYFEEVIERLLHQDHVEFIGEIGEGKKGELIGNAKALLFPIDWPEPFGLVMIEAMACGTPVIAFNRGSVPEVIDHGQSGFIVANVQEAVKALENIDLLERNNIRKIFENRFSSTVMAKEYVSVYEQLIASFKNQVKREMWPNKNRQLAG